MVRPRPISLPVHDPDHEHWTLSAAPTATFHRNRGTGGSLPLNLSVPVGGSTEYRYHERNVRRSSINLSSACSSAPAAASPVHLPRGNDLPGMDGDRWHHGRARLQAPSHAGDRPCMAADRMLGTSCAAPAGAAGSGRRDSPATAYSPISSGGKKMSVLPLFRPVSVAAAVVRDDWQTACHRFADHPARRFRPGGCVR